MNTEERLQVGDPELWPPDNKGTAPAFHKCTISAKSVQGVDKGTQFRMPYTHTVFLRVKMSLSRPELTFVDSDLGTKFSRKVN